MLFNSPIFVFAFLPAVLVGFVLLGGQPRLARAWLGTSSIVFYGWWEPSHVLLLLGSILGNYVVGKAFIEDRVVGTARRTALVVGVVGNLGLLGYFKYAIFTVSVANDIGAGWSLPDILLPAGISFFTFQQIAYLVDTHQRLVRDPDFINYVLFVTFFPQLIAGPIVHHTEMMPQFAKPETYRPVAANIALGLSIFAVGLFKKVVLADIMSSYADPIWANAARGGAPDLLAAWLALSGFTLQVFFDFSAYSDMAVGLGLMFNIRLPTNFTTPYKATSLIDLWRGWHITLTRFFRDYVYLKIGGNRKSVPRRLWAMFLVMILSGIWHGAGWTFIVWGALNGAFLVANYLWRGVVKRDARFAWTEGRPWAVACWFLTMGAWMLTLVFFRAADLKTAWAFLGSLVGANGIALPTQLYAAATRVAPALVESLAISGTSPVPTFGLVFGLLWAALLFAIALMMPTTLQWFESQRPTLDLARQWFAPSLVKVAWQRSALDVAITGGLAFTSFVALFGSGAAAFIYFQF